MSTSTIIYHMSLFFLLFFFRALIRVIIHNPSMYVHTCVRAYMEIYTASSDTSSAVTCSSSFSDLETHENLSVGSFPNFFKQLQSLNFIMMPSTAMMMMSVTILVCDYFCWKNIFSIIWKSERRSLAKYLYLLMVYPWFPSKVPHFHLPFLVSWIIFWKTSSGNNN